MSTPNATNSKVAPERILDATPTHSKEGTKDHPEPNNPESDQERKGGKKGGKKRKWTPETSAAAERALKFAKLRVLEQMLKVSYFLK